MMNEQGIKNILGLAQRAKLLVSGTFKVEEALKSGRVKLLIITTDSSEASIQEYEKISAEKKLPLLKILTKESLGHCLGKDFRAVAAVLDDGFTKKILELAG